MRLREFGSRLLRLRAHAPDAPPAPRQQANGILDAYVRTAPSAQNAIDIFKGSWSSLLPVGSESGTTPLFEDPRVDWIVSQHGSLDGARVLELGPLEAGHTTMLSRAGASVTAIESNSVSFLKCLVVKEILGLESCRFEFGDFVPYLEATSERFDLVVASGVLYHSTDPVHLLEQIASVTDHVGLWTHYFDDSVIGAKPDLARQFPAESRTETAYGEGIVRLYRRDYLEALQWQGFCGGPETFAMWMDRASLIEALHAVGFTDISVAWDDTDNPNGPNLLLYARRSSN